MIPLHTLRPPSSIRLILEVAQEKGWDHLVCLEDTSLTEAELYLQDCKVTVEQEVRVIENLIGLSPSNLGLGLEVARRTHLNSFGIWGFAVLTSPTLRSAIETAISYARVSFLIADLSLEDTPGEARIAYGMSGLPLPVRYFVLERHAHVTMMFFRELIQKLEFNDFQIETSLSDETYAEALSSQIGVQVIAGSDRDALVFDSSWLEQCLPKSDPVTLKYCLDQCDRLAESLQSKQPPWSQKVQDAVMEQIDVEQKIDLIAKKLSVTERTLRRRLSDEGTNFRDIYTNTRLAIANQLLETAGLTVDTVSWRVGYSEPASFVRAFSKKYGRTPGEVRRAVAH